MAPGVGLTGRRFQVRDVRLRKAETEHVTTCHVILTLQYLFPERLRFYALPRVEKLFGPWKPTPDATFCVVIFFHQQQAAAKRAELLFFWC